jgi:hypothetical protein
MTAVTAPVKLRRLKLLQSYVCWLQLQLLHVKELLELEKSKVKEKDVDMDRLCKETTATKKNLGAKRTTKEKLVQELHKLKERASKQKWSGID